MRVSVSKSGVVFLSLCVALPALGATPFVIEPGPEREHALADGAELVQKAQGLAREKKFPEAVEILVDVAQRFPAAEHDCNLSLGHLRAGDLTRAQLLWDVASLRNARRPDWCTGNLSKELATALRAF